MNDYQQYKMSYFRWIKSGEWVLWLWLGDNDFYHGDFADYRCYS